MGNFFNALILTAALEGGVIDGLLVQYQPESIITTSPMYASIDFSAEAYGFFFDTGIDTSFFKMESGVDFYPTDVSFRIGGGLKLGPLTFGYKHLCYHPITPYNLMLDYDKRIIPKQEGGYNSFYFRFKVGGRKD